MTTTEADRTVGSDPTSLLPWKRWNLNAFMCTYIGVCHALALHSILILVLQALTRTESVSPVKTGTLWFAFALWPITGLGITAGAHRLWAHKSYECHSVVKFVLMLANSIANQGSIFHWARDHRTHHLHSDTVADPHDANRGFFYSHVGWLLVQKPREVVAAGRKLDCSDLLKDPLVMFQKRADPWWNLAWCFAVPAFACVYLFGDTLWNGFLYAGVLRYVYVLHCTWSVNSIVHAFGPSPYDPAERPAESRLVSWLAMGEGWHSWHHAFAFDYAAAELGALQQWNPTKVFLDALSVVGLVWGRKRGHRMWGERKQRMRESAAREGLTMVEKLSGPPMWKVRELRWYKKHGEEMAVEGRSEGEVVRAASWRGSLGISTTSLT